MKASIKFRDDQNPKLKAKIPLNILGLPLQSAIEVGDTKEDLSLNLSTFFDSGPLFKLSYRPNDSSNPFSLVLRTGIGHFGSPIGASLLMSTEFRLLGGNQNPRFFLHFRPHLGDFSLKRSIASAEFNLQSKVVKSDDDDLEDSRKRIERLLFSGVEFNARTSFRVRERSVVSLRWSTRSPAEILRAGLGKGEMPFLVLSKIGIEHVSRGSGEGRAKDEVDDLAGTCLEEVKRDLQILQAESGLLKKRIEELQSELCTGGKSCAAAGEKAVNEGKKER